MGREEVVIWAWRGLLYAGKPTCRKAAPSKKCIHLHQCLEHCEKIVFGVGVGRLVGGDFRLTLHKN